MFSSNVSVFTLERVQNNVKCNFCSFLYIKLNHFERVHAM